eukprot:gene9579-54719_t
MPFGLGKKAKEAAAGLKHAADRVVSGGPHVDPHAWGQQLRAGGGEEVASIRAEVLWKAMLGWGTDEATGEWDAVRDAYREAAY